MSPTFPFNINGRDGVDGVDGAHNIHIHFYTRHKYQNSQIPVYVYIYTVPTVPYNYNYMNIYINIGDKRGDKMGNGFSDRPQTPSDRPMTLTCLSCSNYRTMVCHLGQPGWPNETLADCWAGQYEPGSDEAEDDDQPNEETNDE